MPDEVGLTAPRYLVRAPPLPSDAVQALERSSNDKPHRRSAATAGDIWPLLVSASPPPQRKSVSVCQVRMWMLFSPALRRTGLILPSSPPSALLQSIFRSRRWRLRLSLRCAGQLSIRSSTTARDRSGRLVQGSSPAGALLYQPIRPVSFLFLSSPQSLLR